MFRSGIVSKKKRSLREHGRKVIERDIGLSSDS